ncbi:hypothetical protein FHG87_002621 [Trinorchestia longiramus]|nr:hypothetical protein FHG87_002621 [Trinorchestia longiramus]
MDLSKTSMGNKWRGIAKKGKRRDVGLLEPSNSSTGEKPVPYMPALDKQRGPVSLQSPSLSVNRSGAADPTRDSGGTRPISADRSGAASRNSDSEKTSSSSHKNSVSVAGSNTSYGKYGRNSIKVDKKHTGIKSRKKSFDVLGHSEKATSHKPKLHRVAQSGGKNSLNNGSTKGNSHKLTVKEKSGTSNDAQSKMDKPKKLEHSKSWDHRSGRDGDRGSPGPSNNGEPTRIKKPKKKKCGFMRPSQPKKETKISPKIVQRVLDFSKPAKISSDVVSFNSEKLSASEIKAQKINTSSSSSRETASKSRSCVNKMHEDKSKLNIAETRSRESQKTSRKANNLKKLIDESPSRSRELLNEAPVESFHSFSAVKTCSGSSKEPSTDDHHSEKSHSSSKRRNHEKSEFETSLSEKFGKTSSRCSSESRYSRKDSFENQKSRSPSLQITTNSSNSLPHREEINCDTDYTNRKDEVGKEKHDVVRHTGKNTRISIEPDACQGTSNLNKKCNSEPVAVATGGSEKSIPLVDRMQKPTEQTRAITSEKVVDNNSNVGEERARSSRPRLQRVRVNERRTRSSVGCTGDSDIESIDGEAKTSINSHKRDEARSLRFYSFSGQHKDFVHESSRIHAAADSSVLCKADDHFNDSGAIGSVNVPLNVDETGKDDMKPEELARNPDEDQSRITNSSCKKSSDSCEKMSNLETKVTNDKVNNQCSKPELLSNIICSSNQEANSIEDLPTYTSSSSSSDLKNFHAAQLSKCTAVQDSSNNSGTAAECTVREKSSFEITDPKDLVNESQGMMSNVIKTVDNLDRADDSKSFNRRYSLAMLFERQSFKKTGKIEPRNVRMEPSQFTENAETKLSLNEEKSSILDESGCKKETEELVTKRGNSEQSLNREEIVSGCSGSDESSSREKKAEEKALMDSNSSNKKRVRLDRNSFNKSDKIKEVVEEIIKETSPQKSFWTKSPAQSPTSPKKKLIVLDPKSEEKLSTFSFKCHSKIKKASLTSRSSSGDESSILQTSDENEPLDHSASTSEVKTSPSVRHEESEMNCSADVLSLVRLCEANLIENSDSSSLNESTKKPSENMATDESCDTSSGVTGSDSKQDFTENSQKVEDVLRNVLGVTVERGEKVDGPELISDIRGTPSSIFKCDENNIESSNSASNSLNYEQDTTLHHVTTEQEIAVKSNSKTSENQDVLQDSPSTKLQSNDVETSMEKHGIISPENESTVTTSTEPNNSDYASSNEMSEVKVSNPGTRESKTDSINEDSSAPASVKASLQDSSQQDSMQEKNLRRSSLRSRCSSTQASTPPVGFTSSTNAVDEEFASGEAEPSVTEMNCASELPAGQSEERTSSSIDIPLQGHLEGSSPEVESGEKSLNKDDKSSSPIEEPVHSEGVVDVSETSESIDATETRTSSVPEPSVSSDTKIVDESSSMTNKIETDRGEVTCGGEVDSSDTQETNDACSTSVVSAYSDTTHGCPGEKMPQKSNTSNSDSATAEHSDSNDEPTTRILRGRIIEPKKPVVPKTLNLSTSLNDHQTFIKSTDCLRVHLKPIIRLTHTPLLTVGKTVKPSIGKKSIDPKPSIPEMKDCLIVPPPPERLPVLVTDDRKAVPMNKRQHRGQLVLVVNVQKHAILDVAYLDDGKMMRYPLRKSRASDTSLLLDSPDLEEKELLKVTPKEREKTMTNSVRQAISNTHSSGTDTGDQRSAVPLIKTKHVSTVNKLEMTSLNSATSTLEGSSSLKRLSPIVKIQAKLKEVSNDQKSLSESEASTSRGSTPLPLNNESEGNQNRSKRQPKASQKLLESFESGILDVFKSMSMLKAEKLSDEMLPKSKEKPEDEVTASKPHGKQLPGPGPTSACEKDMSATITDDAETFTALKNSGDSGNNKEVAVRKKRPLEEESSDVCTKKKKKREDSDVSTICCGEDFKSSFDLQRHMVKKAREGDADHIKKLQASGYDKCSRCPAWIRASMMAVHLQNIHNESSHASTKLQIQTTVIKLKKQTVPGKNIFNETSANESFPSFDKKSYTSKKKPFVDLGERISVSESNINSDENEECNKTKGRRGRKPALKGILSNKQNVPKNKSLNKKSVTLKSPDRHSSASDINSDESEDSQSFSSSSSETSSSRRYLKKKKFKRSACTIDSFDDRDNYKPNAKEGRGFEPLSEHSFIDHSENSRAQIKTKQSLRSSRRCPDIISPLLEKNPVGRRKKLPVDKSWRKNSFSSSDEQSSAESDSESLDSDSDSSSSTSGDDKENIPLVELDMFTFPSDDFAIFLMDPKNPKLKVYTSMDTIFVSDVSLGNEKKQVSYLTENNNIIYANHNHPVFPNPSDLQSHVPRPLLVMKMTKLGPSTEKNSLTTVSANVLKDSNSPAINRQSSSVSKVTELLSELICKSVKSPRNSKSLKSVTVVKSSAYDYARVQPKPTDENVVPEVAVGNSEDQQLMLDSDTTLQLSPMKSSMLDGSNPSLQSTKKSKALESPSVSKGDSLSPTSQDSSQSISNHAFEVRNKSLNSACGVDLLQQVISSTISSPHGLEAYGRSQIDSFGEGSIVDPNLSSTLSADEIISCSSNDSRESNEVAAPTIECKSPKKNSDESLSSSKNVHVIRKTLPHSPHKMVLKASGTSISKDTVGESPTKIKIPKQIMQTTSTFVSVSAPTASTSVTFNSSATSTANICTNTYELSPTAVSSPSKTNQTIETPQFEKSSSPISKDDAIPTIENNVPQVTSKPQKSTWSFLDDDSDEFLATLEFTDTLQSPTCLDSSDGNDSSDNRRKDLISSVKLPEKLPSLVIGDEDFENVFDESNVMFLNSNADEKADPLRNDSPKLEKLSNQLMKKRSPYNNSSISKHGNMSPCEPLPVTPPLESSSRPTFISPPSRKRLQCFDESEGNSPSRTYSKLAYSALSDNDIFGLWPSGASPKVSQPGSPVKEIGSKRLKSRRQDSPLVKHRKLTDNRYCESPSRNLESPYFEPISDEKATVCNESEQDNEKSNDVLSSTRTLDDLDCEPTNTSKKPSFSVRRSSTSISNSSVISPANHSPRDNLANEVSNFSPVNSGNQTPKSSKIKLAVSFDDGSVPLEFSLDSIRKKDLSPREIDKEDDSVWSGSANVSVTESPPSVLPSKVTSTDRFTPVQFASDDDLGCISGNESPASQHEMKSKKSGRRKEKKSKSKKKKKEKHRHHSPVRPSSDNKGIRMKINLIGMTSEVMNSEAFIPRRLSPCHKLFSTLIEASKTLNVVHFERPFTELQPRISGVDTQFSSSPASNEYHNVNRGSCPPGYIELIDASKSLATNIKDEACTSDEQPERDPLLLEDYPPVSAKEHLLSVRRNSIGISGDAEVSRQFTPQPNSESTGKYSPSRRKRRYSGSSNTKHFSKKLKNLDSEVASKGDGYVSDDVSCVSPECWPSDVKPLVESNSPREKVKENMLSAEDEEKEESMVSPRQWLGRGAKLRAAVLIQDQQEGITDSQVISSGSPIVTESIRSPTSVPSPIAKEGQILEPSLHRKPSRSPISVRNRRSSTSVFIAGDSNQVSPRHSTPIVRRASADTTTSPEDRTWHSRGAKLRAQVLISDLQSGVENSSVIVPVSPKPVSPDSSQAPVYSRNDIRYFFQPKKKLDCESTESSSNVASGSRPKSDIPSFLLPKQSRVESPPSNERKKHYKRSREFDGKSKDNLELDKKRHRPIPSATDVNIPVNNLRCWYESRCSRLAIAVGGVPLGSGNFVGFDSLEPYSGARAQTLRHVITLANMKKWNQQSNLYPVAVDQIFDWDEEELVSVLNL